MTRKTTEDNRAHLIRVAGAIALFGNLILCLIKIFFAHMSGSLAVMGDGIDSATDTAIALVTIIISKIIAMPEDTSHPWGHGRAETVATMFLAFIIFFAGIELGVSSIRHLLAGCPPIDNSIYAVTAAAVSIAGKSLLALSQIILSKKSGSSILRANALNMKNDILMSSAVLAGICASVVFKMSVLDPVIAILISLWVIKSAIEIFSQMNLELMDGNTDTELYKKLFDAVMSVKGVSNPHRARIRKIASHWDIDLDIEVDASMTVHDAHEKCVLVEKAIRKVIPDVFDIMVHIEPAGHSDHHEPEQFGLAKRDVETPRQMAEEVYTKEYLE